MIKYDDLPNVLKVKAMYRYMFGFARDNQKQLNDYVIEILDELTPLEKALYGIKEEHDN